MASRVNKFDIFLENEENRPFDGCKILIYSGRGKFMPQHLYKLF